MTTIKINNVDTPLLVDNKLNPILFTLQYMPSVQNMLHNLSSYVVKETIKGRSKSSKTTIKETEENDDRYVKEYVKKFFYLDTDGNFWKLNRETNSLDVLPVGQKKPLSLFLLFNFKLPLEEIEFIPREVVNDTKKKRFFNSKKCDLIKYMNAFAQMDADLYEEQEFTKETTDKLEAFLYHIKHIICRDDEDCFNYVKQYIKNIFHKKKNPTNLLMKSLTQRTGKTLFIQIITSIIGYKFYYQETDPDFFVKRSYNMLGKLIVHLEEPQNASTSDFVNTSNILKTLTTEYKFTPKGIYYNCKNSMNNTASILISTNSFSPVKIEEQDGRYLVLDVSDEMVGNKDYFAPLVSIKGDEQKGIKGDRKAQICIFQYFYLMKDQWKDITKIPMTYAKAEIIKECQFPGFNYLINNFLIKKCGYDNKLIELTKGINENCKNKKHVYNVKEIKSILKNKGINTIQKSHQDYVYMDYENLKDFIIKNKFISLEELTSLQENYKDENGGSIFENQADLEIQKMKEQKKRDDDYINTLKNQIKEMQKNIDFLSAKIVESKEKQDIKEKVKDEINKDELTKEVEATNFKKDIKKQSIPDFKKNLKKEKTKKEKDETEEVEDELLKNINTIFNV